MTEFLDWLNDAPHKGCPNDYFHDLLRSWETEKLDADLSLAFATFDSDVLRTCAAHDSRNINITGWRELFADWFLCEKERGQITAILINISGHYEGSEPRIETSFYANDPSQPSKFQFLKTNLTDIHEDCKAYPSKWTGGGDGFSNSLFLQGFSDIIAARDSVANTLHDEDNTLPPDEQFRRETHIDLCNWYIYLQFFEHLKNAVNRVGLPARVPVIMGQHDFGPWVGMAFENTTLQSLIPSAGDFLEGQTTEVSDKKKLYRLEQIQKYTDWYDFSRKLNMFSSADRKKLQAYYVKTFKNEFGMRKIKVARPLHKMQQSEFDALMQIFLNHNR